MKERPSMIKLTINDLRAERLIDRTNGFISWQDRYEVYDDDDEVIVVI